MRFRFLLLTSFAAARQLILIQLRDSAGRGRGPDRGSESGGTLSDRYSVVLEFRDGHQATWPRNAQIARLARVRRVWHD